MSRLSLDPKNTNHSIVVGFDSTLESYFIFVEKVSNSTALLTRAQDDLQDLRSMNLEGRYERSDVIRTIDLFALENEKSNQVVEAIVNLHGI